MSRQNKRETDNSLESGDTHETRDLTCHNVDSRAGHESADRWERYELDDPTEPKKTDAQHNKSTNEGEGSSNLGAFPFVWMCALYSFDDLRDCKRHDCNGTDGHILRCSEELSKTLRGGRRFVETVTLTQ